MQPTPTVVTRSLSLPAPAEEVWASLRDAEGLARWLGDAVDLDEVAAGAAGTVREGETVRRLVVTEVDAGRSLGFAWWDEAAPAVVSVVTISLAPTPGHVGEHEGTTVTVTERLAGGVPASLGSASVDDLLCVGPAWDRRLQALLGAPARTATLV